MKGKTSPAEVKIILFGTPRIETNGEPIQFDTRKAVALMAYLAVTGNPQSRDHLAGFLWPDSDQSHAYGALRRTLSVLNSALSGKGLAAQRDSIAITSDAWCDVHAFRSAIAQGELAEGIALYSDDFMAGFALRDSAAFDDWQFEQSESLRRELGEALEELARGHVEAARIDDATQAARRWLSLDALNEPAHRLLMALYAQRGDRAAALRQYRECVRALGEALGVPPLSETTSLYEAIKSGEAIATTPSPELPPPATDDARAMPEPTRLLVGRFAEREGMLRTYDAVAHKGVGRLVVLHGEVGIGKTQLALAVLDEIEQHGAPVVRLRCFEGESGLAFAPIIEAMRAALALSPERVAQLPSTVLADASHLLPELARVSGGTQTPSLDGPGAQTRLFEAACRVVVAALPHGALFIDDVHWADAATLDVLTYLTRRLHTHPLLVLLVWRDDQVPPQHPLRQLLATAQRDGSAASITLARFNAAESATLAQALLGSRISARDSSLWEWLHQESEGLPLFLVEYASALQRDEIHIDTATGQVPSGTPQTVRGLLQARLAKLDDASHQLLGAAAVIGRSFEPELLQHVSGRNADETATGLDVLARARLVRESEADYDFTHDKLREMAYDDIGLARRRLLHGRVADGLLVNPRARRTQARGALSALAAQHLERAGRDDEAAAQYRAAGDYTRGVYANAEAIAHYRRALALGHAEAGALHENIADLLTLGGSYREAIRAYETAAATVTGNHLGVIEHKLGNVYHRLGEWRTADAHYAAALLQAQDDAAQEARVLIDQSLNAHRAGNAERASELAGQVLAEGQQAHDTRVLAQAHNLIGMLARSHGDLVTGIGEFEQSLSLSRSVNDVSAHIAASNNLALALADDGEHDRALGLLEAALRECTALGDRHREAALHNNIADVLHAMHRPDEAMRHLTQAVTIFAEIGVSAGEWQPEIWKLAEW